MSIDPEAPDPVYLQLAKVLEDGIRSGRVRGRLPGERSLAEEYGVSYGSVRHAMQLLRERGLIRTIHGRGTFATPEPPASI
jgi:DNA-binding GntR family transcriptional regulator